jgi:hypothetical protein
MCLLQVASMPQFEYGGSATTLLDANQHHKTFAVL